MNVLKLLAAVWIVAWFAILVLFNILASVGFRWGPAVCQ